MSRPPWRPNWGRWPGRTAPRGALDGWGRLVVDQSPLLRGAEGAVERYLGAEAPGNSATPVEELPAGQPARDHDDIAEQPEAVAAPEDIVARTLVPTSTQGYEFADGVYLYNRTKLTVDLAAAVAEPVGDRPDGRGTPDPHRTYPWHGGLHAGRDRSLSALGQQYPHAGRGV